QGWGAASFADAGPHEAQAPADENRKRARPQRPGTIPIPIPIPILIPSLLCIALLTACPAQNSNPCNTDSDCGANQRCRRGACGPVCLADTDCGTSQVCSGGACVPRPECAVDTDCADRFTCTNGRCQCVDDT